MRTISLFILTSLLAAPASAQSDVRVLATSKTSTMEKEMNDAGDAGFEFKGQTVFKSTFGGKA